MSHNHTPIDIDLFISRNFGGRKIVTSVVFFTLGVFTAIIFLTVFYAIGGRQTISLLQ